MLLLPYLEYSWLYDRIDWSLPAPGQISWEGPEYTMIDGKPLISYIIPVYQCPSETTGKTLIGREDSNPAVPDNAYPSAISSYGGSIGSQKMDNNVPCDMTTIVGAGDDNGDGQDWFGNGSLRWGGDWAKTGNKIFGVFARSGWAASVHEITDGTSHTIAFMEIRQYCGVKDTDWLGWASARAMWYASGPINFPTCAGENGVPGPPGYVPFSEGFHSGQSYTTSHAAKSLHPGGANFCLCDGSVRFIDEEIYYPIYQALGDRRDGRTIGEY